MSDEPKRLFEGGPEVPAALVQALTAAQAELPDAETLARVSAAVSARASTLALLKLGALALGISAIAALGWWWWPSEAPPPPLTPDAEMLDAGMLDAGGSDAGGSAALELESEDGGVAVLDARALTRAARPSPRPSAVEDEMVLVERAEQRMRAEPAQALAIVQVLEEHYPKGSLVEERESIAIQALLGLQRREEARARFARLLANYPRTPHRVRLTKLLEETE